MNQLRDGDDKEYGWPLFAAFFILVAAAFVTRAVLNAGSIPLFGDTDDALRLVTVRDLLAGQGWYDIVQHRLNTPYGAEIHWSRLVDLPIAGLTLLLQPFAGASTSMLVGFAWPLLLLLALLILMSMVCHELVGRQGRLAAIALPALSLVTMTEFAPGRLDHHSIQILLMLGLLWCTVKALGRPRFAIAAGLAAATAIAIGVESIPTIAATTAAFGLLWVFRPERADALRYFGLSFGFGTLLHLAIATPPERWLLPACDAISITYAAATLATGAIFVALSFLPLAQRHFAIRLAALAAGGALVLALLALAFPDCLRGPYAALDPWLVSHWLSNVAEAEPLWTRLMASPAYPLAVAVPPLLALVITAWRLWRGPAEGRAPWLVYGLFLIVAVLVMLLQIRACRFATILAVPAGAWLIVAMRQRYLQKRSILNVLGLVGAWLSAAGLAVFFIAGTVAALFPAKGGAETVAGKSACLQPEAFADLSGVPPERIMAPVDLGSHLLAFTPHSVVGAPYHRNETGVRDTFAFFNDPITKARLILDIRGVTLVVICPAMTEVRGLPDAAPNSFARLYAAGNLPDWLEEESFPDAVLKIFSVKP